MEEGGVSPGWNGKKGGRRSLHRKGALMWRTRGTCCEEGGESQLVEMEALMWWSK